MGEEGTSPLNQQAEALAEAHKKILEGWCEFLKVAPGLPPFSPGLYDQWWNLIHQAIDAFTKEAEPLARDVARRLINSQETVIRLLGLSASALKTLSFKVEAGGVLAESPDRLSRGSSSATGPIP